VTAYHSAPALQVQVGIIVAMPKKIIIIDKILRVSFDIFLLFIVV
jgi:hypothetical protein